MKLEELGKLKDKLPISPGINGRDEYFNSVVLVPLALLEGEYHFIFQKRNSKIRQGGEISFPGGMYSPEEDKDIMSTATRETFEEMGISEDKITIIGALDTVIAPAGVVVDAFLSVISINSLDEITINKDEVEYAFTVPVSYFETHEPYVYKVRVMIEPSYIDNDGSEIILLPSRELNLPKIYENPWGGRLSKVYVYKYMNEVIWGITARFVYDIMAKLK